MEKVLAAKVTRIQEEQAAAAEKARQEAEIKAKSAESVKREKAWEQQQAALWIKRCQKHWQKGVSPCFCEKYLDQAPPGVNNTCGR